MFSSLVILDIAIALTGLVFVWRLCRIRSRDPPFPPGPRGIPFLGNLLDMPSEKEWLTFAEWGEKYGMLFHHSTTNTAYSALARRYSVGFLSRATPGRHKFHSDGCQHARQEKFNLLRSTSRRHGRRARWVEKFHHFYVVWNALS